MKDDERFNSVEPPDDIPCRDCIHRLKPLMGFERFKRGNCKKYPEPWHKPVRVLWHGEDCAYYEEDPDE